MSDPRWEIVMLHNVTQKALNNANRIFYGNDGSLQIKIAKLSV